jgi:hypothetical protein
MIHRFTRPAVMGVLVAVGPWLAAGAGLGVSSPVATPPPFQWRGEFALAVADSADQVIVRWMTEGEDSGSLAVGDGARELHRLLTPPGLAHRATFRRPRGKSLTLVYGDARGTLDTTVIDLEPPARPRSRITGADSVFVVGDVHGKYESLRQTLIQAGVVDQAGSWRAGRAHLVFAGDLIDRGDDATRVLWFVYRLEREARAAGGAVDVLLGNHEIMEWVGDRRYLAPRESLLAERYGTCYRCLYDLNSSVLGRWLASKPGIVQINDVVYVHGGITVSYARLGISGFNDALFRYLREPIFPRLLEDSAAVARFGSDLYHRRSTFFFAPESPFWFRGYVQSDTLGAQLDSVLAAYGASALVVGHTPVVDILPLYRGKLIPVNVADFATQLVLFTYRKDGKRKSQRIGLRVPTESW